MPPVAGEGGQDSGRSGQPVSSKRWCEEAGLLTFVAVDEQGDLDGYC